MPIMQTIADVVTITWMIVMVGASDGNGGRGNVSGEGDARLRCCGDGDGCGVCGQLRTGRC